MSRILVTGANGFVGRALCTTLLRSGHEVRGAVRASGVMPDGVEQVAVGEIGAATDWRAALESVDAVIHAAARVHVLDDSPANDYCYFETNSLGTRSLALAAAAAGVRRVVLVSSIKVNGEGGDARVYRASDPPNPRDAYGRSKAAAEAQLFEVAKQSGIEAAVLRAPLVYGPGVRANFLRLMNWVQRGVPLPFGAIQNLRSLVGLGNLCDLLAKIHDHPAAAGKVWLVSDGEDLSTPDLVRAIAVALGVRARLLPVPITALQIAARLAGRSAEFARLCGSLQVDSTPARELLGWRPPNDLQAELAETARWFRARTRT